MAEPSSPLDSALDRLGDRWSLRVIEALLDGPRRYGELTDAIRGIAPNILADRLRRLERDGLLASRAYNERPARLEYRLTQDGRALASVVHLLAAWAAADVPGANAGDIRLRRHEACGTPVEVRWYCPTCATVVDDDEEHAGEYRL
jgi:DNA-binding HxlR family transcriptional regulator